MAIFNSKLLVYQRVIPIFVVVFHPHFPRQKGTLDVSVYTLPSGTLERRLEMEAVAALRCGQSG